MRYSVIAMAIAMPTGVPGQDRTPGIRIEAPSQSLVGVPVPAVEVEILNEDGSRDHSFSGRGTMTGVTVLRGQDGPRDQSELLQFQDGLVRLETDRLVGSKVFLTADVLEVTLADGRAASQSVSRLPGWCSLLPALLAIALAIVLRETLIALFVSVWAGLTLLTDGSKGLLWRVAQGFLDAVESGLVGQLVPADGDIAHIQIVLFTLFLGCLVGVMSASGGTKALVERLMPVTRTRRGGQVTTIVLGLVVFFDDYANSLLLGSTMRPVTDRLRISREKLAFLVDSTAAPVAGLALVSTWVGFEVGLIGDAFTRLAEQDASLTQSMDAYGTFLATLPYRFYPLLMLAFVVMIAWTGRDFGSMHRAETRALTGESGGRRTVDLQAGPKTEAESQRGPSTAHGTMWNAIVPLAVLLGGIVTGFWITGRANTASDAPSLREIISSADSSRALLMSSFIASLGAVLMAIATGRLSLAAAAGAWINGARSMVLGCAILVLAWAVAMVCDADHLNTAGYLVELTTNRMNIAWIPAVAFLLSAAVSFATGSSWATMGLLIPLVVSVTYGLMVEEVAAATGAAVDRVPIMLASLGSVLAGSIFGDHCSPISDTTVLSSVASDCDHLEHVATQLPYAMCAGLVALIVGCIPVGFGLSPWISLPVGVMVLAGILRMLGHRVIRS